MKSYFLLKYERIAFSLIVSIDKVCVCLPNNVKPLAPIWAVICAGPVSFEITNELFLIKEVSWEISKALPLSNIAVAFIFWASLNSDGPGAVIIL